MFPARYFPVRYFAPRYWPVGGTAAPVTTIVLTTLEGRQLDIFAAEVLAVEEQLTETGSPIYTGVRSKVYIEDHSYIVRATAAAVITLVQALDPFTATIVVTTVAGRQATILAAPIAAVEERITDLRSPIYAGVRSRLYLEEQIIDVRLTSAALKALIDAA